MFPSGEMGPSWETSGALLLQEGNKYTGWIRLRILAGYKCDSKWLSRITVRQGRRKCSLLTVIVRVELLSSYFYFLRCFSKGTAEPFLCLRVRVYVKCGSRFTGLPAVCRDVRQRTAGRDSEQRCAVGGALGCRMQPGGAGLSGCAQLTLSKCLFLRDLQVSAFQPSITNFQASTQTDLFLLIY